MIAKIRDCDTDEIEMNSKNSDANCFGKKHLRNTDRGCSGCPYDSDFTDFIEILENLSPVELSRKTGNEKATTQGHATRTKKRALSKVFTVFELVDKLGFKISIEPKN